MQKALVANGPNLAVTEKTGQANRPQLLLDHLGIVVGLAKQALAASIATAEAAAVEWSLFDGGFSSNQQFVHILGGRRRRTPLELDGLAQARQSADGDAAGAGIGSEQIADEEIAAMEFVTIFIDDQADKEIAARLLLF